MTLRDGFRKRRSRTKTNTIKETFVPLKTLSAFFVASILAALSAVAGVQPYPNSFRVQEIPVNGTTLHVRVGGHGPAVVLLHGYGETGDMWEPLAAALVGDHTVIVPDLRGMGLSGHPATGYDKKNQGRDVSAV